MRNIFTLLLTICLATSQAQELNCTVTVNAEKVGATNNQVFQTLEKSLNEFVNRTDWTGQGFRQNERINCAMFITVNSYNTGTFNASIQVQSARPVFNSTYSSPIININDKDFTFNYTEFQNLSYNPTAFDSNLIAVIAFYSHMIIGMDADTFSPQGGSPYLATAQDIANLAQQSGYAGWSQGDGNQNRFFLINDMLAPTFAPYRQAMYEYHYLGLDNMAKDQKVAKENIKTALGTLRQLYSVRPNAYITRVFFDAKSDEIVSIFSGGPNIPITDLVDNLNRLSPTNASKWSAIKF
ncbi:MAG TPA: DUF4835 family protein [Flavobacterium sp.]|jgi:hypothetical protein